MFQLKHFSSWIKRVVIDISHIAPYCNQNSQDLIIFKMANCFHNKLWGLKDTPVDRFTGRVCKKKLWGLRPSIRYMWVPMICLALCFFHKDYPLPGFIAPKARERGWFAGNKIFLFGFPFYDHCKAIFVEWHILAMYLNAILYGYKSNYGKPSVVTFRMHAIFKLSVTPVFF